MRDLDFQVTDVQAATRGLSPLLNFKVHVTSFDHAPVESLILQAQIQIQSPRRNYNTEEKEKLVELFGTPGRWGQTLRNKLWTIANITVGRFEGETDIVLQVPCSFDLNIIATKYFYALEGGEVPLLFLFSGTVFHSADDGRLQVARISWNKECTFRMPVAKWNEMMQQHYPDCAWLSLQSDVFEQIYAYRRRNAIPTWDETIRRLLAQAEAAETLTSHETAISR